jgi:hypothetical protein
VEWWIVRYLDHFVPTTNWRLVGQVVKHHRTNRARDWSSDWETPAGNTASDGAEGRVGQRIRNTNISSSVVSWTDSASLGESVR